VLIKDQNKFIEQNSKKLDGNQRTNYPQFGAQRWLAVRLESMGSLIVLLAGVFSFVQKGMVTPGLAALSLTYSLQITGSLSWTIRQLTESETSMNAIERLNHYCENIQIEGPITIFYISKKISSEVFETFIKYHYGCTITINENNREQLLELADKFLDSKLKSICNKECNNCVIANNFKPMIENPLYSDVDIILDDGKIPAHKIILCGRSEFFKGMFSHGMKEALDNKAVLHKKKKEILPLIEYLYCDSVLSATDITGIEILLPVAHEYNIQSLISICEGILLKEINIENAFDIITLADSLNINSLKENSLIWLGQHWQAWQNSNVIKEMKADTDNSKLLKLIDEYRYPPLEYEEKYKKYLHAVSIWQKKNMIRECYFLHTTTV